MDPKCTHFIVLSHNITRSQQFAWEILHKCFATLWLWSYAEFNFKEETCLSSLGTLQKSTKYLRFEITFIKQKDTVNNSFKQQQKSSLIIIIMVAERSIKIQRLNQKNLWIVFVYLDLYKHTEMLTKSV